jgi:hypothetical protein
MGSTSEGWEIKWLSDLCDLKLGIDGGGVRESGWRINSQAMNGAQLSVL